MAQVWMGLMIVCSPRYGAEGKAGQRPAQHRGASVTAAIREAIGGWVREKTHAR